ncbi:LysR family transcriptional regulator [Dokdonella sp.]|uniref:LysR family transcriptional regulator n=1 Tax=Dokdonella sp. TaxID=2291710 RepID=UPI0025C4DC52|nr:LysR family transcriptional regulator [Dokdonella sp.]
MNALVQAPLDGRDPLTSSFSASYAGVVAFIAVATEGSFARAGDRLGIGRSAVSRSVQKLEGQLGTRLFLRTTRATSLTREGERFFEHCRPGVERILQALEEMRDLREGPPRGLLRIGATPGFGRKVVAPLLRPFRARFPGVALELLLDERDADLVTGRVDVAFREGVLDDSQVIAKQLIPMRRLVCASPAYARRHGLPQSIEDLARHACINRRLPNGRLCRWDFKRDGRAADAAPSADLVFNDPELVLHAVLAGDGLAQLPAYQASEPLRAGTLVACLEAFSPDDGGHYLCYLSREQLPKRIRAFVDFMSAQVRALDLDCCARPQVERTAPTVDVAA